MNRYCVICDSYTPSHIRMVWNQDEGGYCCPSCAASERLEVVEGDYFEDEAAQTETTKQPLFWGLGR